jgi:hypothetical protein
MSEQPPDAGHDVEPESNHAAEAERLRARHRARLMNALLAIGTVAIIVQLTWLTGGFALLLIIPLAPGLLMTAARIGIQEETRRKHGIAPEPIGRRLSRAFEDVVFGFALSVLFLVSLLFLGALLTVTWIGVVDRADHTRTPELPNLAAFALAATLFLWCLLRLHVEIVSRVVPVCLALWWRFPMGQIAQRDDRRSATLLGRRFVLAYGIVTGLLIGPVLVFASNDPLRMMARFLLRHRFVSEAATCELVLQAIGILVFVALLSFWFTMVLPWMARRSVRFATLPPRISRVGGGGRSREREP